MKYILMLGIVFVQACQGVKQGVYPDHNEMKKGPGLFTGEQGEYVILGSDQPSAEDQALSSPSTLTKKINDSKE